MNHKIAIVDDQACILESLMHVFKDEPYQLFAFQNTSEVLDRLDKEKFSVIIADQVMPDMNGINFLNLIKQRRPDTVCIIMTAHADLNFAVDTINQGGIFKFIIKPWDVIEIKSTIRTAIDQYELKAEINQLVQVIEKQNIQLLELNKKQESVIHKQAREISLKEERHHELEAQLIQSQKVEAIGTLAGGIAHDFNNILAGIMGYVELACLKVEKNSQVENILGNALKACERATSLVSQILTFSRKNKEEMRPMQISPIVEEALKLLKASLPPNIKIKHNIDENIGMIEADPTGIHQILINLSTNAYHAMLNQGGILEVSLTQMIIESDEVHRYNNLDPGAHLKLSVIDTGNGMAQKTLKRIFDPYFTTKEKGEGTGLGLSVVHGIVEKHCGTIIVNSEIGKGTTFHVYLPLCHSQS